MHRDRARDLIERFYTAFANRNEPELRTLLHRDVKWNQCAGFPGGARRRGVEEVLTAVFHRVRSTWNGFATPTPRR